MSRDLGVEPLAHVRPSSAGRRASATDPRNSRHASSSVSPREAPITSTSALRICAGPRRVFLLRNYQISSRNRTAFVRRHRPPYAPPESPILAHYNPPYPLLPQKKGWSLKRRTRFSRATRAVLFFLGLLLIVGGLHRVPYVLPYRLAELFLVEVWLDLLHLVHERVDDLRIALVGGLFRIRHRASFRQHAPLRRR